MGLGKWLINKLDRRDGICTFIHPTSTGCPDGWIELEGGFVQADGTRTVACVMPGAKTIKIDRIHPGEEARIPVQWFKIDLPKNA